MVQPSLEARRPLGRFPELGCVRHRLPPATVAAAEQRALALGIGADEVLIASGALTEETYYRALAFSLGLPFVDVSELPREAFPFDDEKLALAARADVLALQDDNGALMVAAAPRGLRARGMIASLRANADIRQRVRLTTPGQIRSFVLRLAATRIATDATGALHASHPILSAAPHPRGPARRMLFALGALACGIAAAPAAAIATIQGLLTAGFTASTALRLMGAARSRRETTPSGRMDDAALPRFSIIAALYDEVEALPGLVAAIKALDYPPEKVELILALEADDVWTHLSAEAEQATNAFEIVPVPPIGPRTKPKALNCVLPFVRGDLVVVYDAEDRPEPDQLRRAAAAFRESPDDKLACVQARLTIDNTHDSWLTRLFTAEYAGLFDVLLPGLASLRLPIPLGGSSNHFRTDILRKVGAWDPYNVTEDADLGTRLARFGYRSTTIASTTYEEAPAELHPWLKQRTRWFKGWMQTLVVHSREPRRLWRELGAGGFAAFYLVLGGTLAAALVQPFVMAWIALALLHGTSLVPTEFGNLAAVVGWVHVAALVGGYFAAAALCLAGLKRRGLIGMAGALAAMPILWCLLSVAAWRAAFQLLRKPQLWEKTRHGRARTSRLGEAASSAHK